MFDYIQEGFAFLHVSYIFEGAISLDFPPPKKKWAKGVGFVLDSTGLLNSPPVSRLRIPILQWVLKYVKKNRNKEGYDIQFGGNC